MAKFGWCMSGHHHNADAAGGCPGRIQRFITIPPKRNKPATIEMIDEFNECDCSCHGNEAVKTKTRKRK